MNTKDELLPLTGLRAVAAFWVVGFHFYTSLAELLPPIGGFLTTVFKPGYLGVDLFFLLSGFIIAYNYQDKFVTFRLSAYTEFLWARIARLYPVHFVTLFACLVLYFGAVLTNSHLRTAATNWGGLDFILNLFMIQAWTLSHHPSWNFPSWSISCEWLAYLFFPILAALIARIKTRTGYQVLVALLLLGYPALGLLLSNFGRSMWIFVPIAFEFTAGVTLFQLFRLRRALDKSAEPFWQPLSALILLVAFVGCANFNLREAWLIPVLAMNLYFLAVDDSGPVSRVLKSRLACYWGRVSYSLYMVHAVVSMVLVRLIPLNSFDGSALILRLAVCLCYFGTIVIVAALVYHLIENPSRYWIRRMYPRKSA